jgi:hypothetical protein
MIWSVAQMRPNLIKRCGFQWSELEQGVLVRLERDLLGLPGHNWLKSEIGIEGVVAIERLKIRRNREATHSAY